MSQNLVTVRSSFWRFAIKSRPVVHLGNGVKDEGPSLSLLVIVKDPALLTGYRNAPRLVSTAGPVRNLLEALSHYPSKRVCTGPHPYSKRSELPHLRAAVEVRTRVTRVDLRRGDVEIAHYHHPAPCFQEGLPPPLHMEKEEMGHNPSTDVPRTLVR